MYPLLLTINQFLYCVVSVYSISFAKSLAKSSVMDLRCLCSELGRNNFSSSQIALTKTITAIDLAAVRMEELVQQEKVLGRNLVLPSGNKISVRQLHAAKLSELKTLCRENQLSEQGRSKMVLVERIISASTIDEEAEAAKRARVLHLPDGQEIPPQILTDLTTAELQQVCDTAIHCSGNAPTKKVLIERMEKCLRRADNPASELTDAEEAFVHSSKSFAHDLKHKETIMGGPVAAYKRFFNLEDRFDHFISMFDPKIRYVNFFFSCFFYLYFISKFGPKIRYVNFFL